MPIYLKFGPNKLSHKIQINECYLFGYAPGEYGESLEIIFATIQVHAQFTDYRILVMEESCIATSST